MWIIPADEIVPEVGAEDESLVDEKNGIKKIFEVKWNEEEGKEVKVKRTLSI